jgi:hypothetical protein
LTFFFVCGLRFGSSVCGSSRSLVVPGILASGGILGGDRILASGGILDGDRVLPSGEILGDVGVVVGAWFVVAGAGVGDVDSPVSVSDVEFLRIDLAFSLSGGGQGSVRFVSGMIISRLWSAGSSGGNAC